MPIRAILGSPQAYAAAVSLVPVSPIAAQQCQWSALGLIVDGTGVDALCVFDDGRGEALYAGGSFRTTEHHIVNHIAKWDGAEWSALGPGLSSGIVFELIVFDDGRGGGPALYAGGSFESSGGAPAHRIARWDGALWSEVGGGIWGPPSKPAVGSFAVFDDRRGPALYVAGEFIATGAGISGTNSIARWDGESWSALDNGLGGPAGAMAVYDAGAGPELYVVGRFTTASGVPADNIARWDGSSWSEVGGGLNKTGLALAVFDDGSGPALYVGGSFTSAGGVSANHVARWDGERWSAVGSGVDRHVSAFLVFDDGRGPALYAGGGFTMAGGAPAPGIARWDGQEWSDLGAGVGGSPVPEVVALATYDDGQGQALYAGGNFLTAGGVSAPYIARWRCEPEACAADCDGSGELTFFDFLCFQNLFAALDPGADCDEDGEFTFFDFLCFQNAFAAGCE